MISNSHRGGVATPIVAGLLWAALSTATPSLHAGVIANGVKSTNVDTSTFVFTTPTAGSIVTSLLVPGASTITVQDPSGPPARAGTAATIDTGNLITGVRNGVGVAKPKSATVPTSDAWGRTRTENATGIAAKGYGEWTYTPGAAFFGRGDRATYLAQTDITPVPNPFQPFGPYQAWAESRDPILFGTATENESFLFLDTLDSLTLDMSSGVGAGPVGELGFVGLRSSALLDGEEIYSVEIYVPSNFATADVLVTYRLGGVVDTIKGDLIKSSLTIDPTLGLVTATSPIDLFPESLVLVRTAGTHTLESNLVTVSYLVPSPSSLLLASTGLALIAGLRARQRGRSIATHRDGE